LLDHYYLHEKPIFNDIEKITRLLMLNGYSTDVEHVLNEYFYLVDGYWYNNRADAEISIFHAQKQSKSKAGKASAAKRLGKNQQALNECSTDVQLNNNQETLNKKQNSADKKSAITLKKYLEQCKTEGKPVLPKDSIVFKNAETLGIDQMWLRVCWLEFKSYYMDKRKTYIDWIDTFNNAVKGNYYKIWFKDADGNMVLTSQGRSLIDLHREALNA
jgi:uncharacterized protein YdaU (DUF1376 family)